MCGIVGFSGSDRTALEAATRLLAHRGPDDEGLFVDDWVSLGHRRLSILDLRPAGHQPMFYDRALGAVSERLNPLAVAAAEVGIVFNGEIYNFHEVRAELEAKGYVFATRGDTEVILASYLEWGETCMQRFNGMWAFALVDRRRRTLLLARDRLGVKPLYILDEGGRLIFGSEVKVFLKLGGSRPVAPDSLAYYTAFGFTPPGATMLSGVQKLNPGEALVYDLAERRISRRFRYWDIPWPAPVSRSFGEAAVELRELLTAAVRRRLIADVPVGAFLSGGVDSSIIVALMRPAVADLKTFSVRFDHPEYDESPWSRLVAKQMGTDHHELPFSAADVRSLIDRLPDFYDDPLGDPSMIPTYLVSQVARQHVTVSLSGTGGDELFAGYPRYREALVLQRLRALPRPLRRLLVALYARANPDRARKLEGLLESADAGTLYLQLFSHRFRRLGDRLPGSSGAAQPLPREDASDPLRPMLHVDQSVYLPEALLVKEDRASMAHGLEARVPFLDYTVVEYANSLPPDFKLRGGEGKRILKHAFADVLPRGVSARRKQGFGVPLAAYFRGELRGFAEERLFEPATRGLVDEATVRELWAEHQSGRSDYAQYLWCILSFNVWYSRWLR